MLNKLNTSDLPLGIAKLSLSSLEGIHTKYTNTPGVSD